MSKQTAASFPRSVKERGGIYFRQGQAKVVDHAVGTFETLVHGSRRYDVRLDLAAVRGKPHLVAHCTCPFFDQGDLCKHIWASILQADESGWGASRGEGAKFLPVEWGGEERPADRIVYEDEETQAYDDDFDVPPKRKARRQEPSKAAFGGVASTDDGPFDWQQLLRGIGKTARPRAQPDASRAKELWYGVNFGESKDRGELTLELFQRDERPNGSWSPLKPVKFDRHEARALPAGPDRLILGLLFGAESNVPVFPSYKTQAMPVRTGVFEVPPTLYGLALKMLARTNRCAAIEVASSLPNEAPLQFDEGEPWHFELALKVDPTAAPARDWLLEGRIRRGDELLPLTAPKALLAGGLVLFSDRIAKLVPLSEDECRWATELRENGAAQILAKDLDTFIMATAGMDSFPRLDWPDGTGWQASVGEPTPKLLIFSKPQGRSLAVLTANVAFDYGGRILLKTEAAKRWLDREKKQFVQRDFDAEQTRLSELASLQDYFLTVPEEEDCHVAFAADHLVDLTDTLTARGWIVEAEGHRLQTAAKLEVKVSSGTDWFDLDAGCTFGKEKVSLPALLEALKRGDHFIRLDSGGLGVLPEVWLQRFAEIAEMALEQQAGFRFGKSQAALLDAMLDQLPDASLDRNFSKFRDDLRSYKGVEPGDPAPGFQGSLREYQREGLGWLRFLTRFHLGGCLADDMGLGKTVQVLALLRDRFLAQASERRPSLIVVPRSLVSNWINEAARFCPDLKVLDYATLDRKKNPQLSNYDVVVTTYGVMRRDIEKLAATSFDYAILDEAQAIKNEGSQVAKAARLLRAEHKLALTGTPVENHLGELGSIFAFLNPGMLKPALLAGVGKSAPEKGRRAAGLLSRALRPFILRRTKEQVLKDLPERFEQTLFCELAPPQRKLYEELRRHYQLHLTESAEKHGVNQVKIQVLEALLRLRQAACHPGLIDAQAKAEPSAKLETLLEQLDGVIDGGHKALIFSQFTSLLAIVRSHLDQKGIRYEYLDGQTRDRQRAVDSFQTDPGIPVFLISLKAGGVGLNLTAADYCFILDPWWNPAVEAQAIARAHRMGQKRNVFAYRLIAKDTVEEKILALQEKKRSLADAVISEDSSVLRSLSLEDLRLLLG